MRALAGFKETPRKFTSLDQTAPASAAPAWSLEAQISLRQSKQWTSSFHAHRFAYQLSTITVLFFVCLSARADQLKDYLWTHRVLVTFSSDKSAPERLSIIQQIAQHSCEFRKRDLVHIDLIAGSAAYQTLRQQFSITDKAFRLVLVGKDGKVKLNTDNASMKELFIFIDAMPLRKREVSTEKCYS